MKTDAYKDYKGNKYHAWKTTIFAEHISEEYLGIVEFIRKTGNIFTPFLVKLSNGEVSTASTIDFFTDVKEELLSRLK